MRKMWTVNFLSCASGRLTRTAWIVPAVHTDVLESVAGHTDMRLAERRLWCACMIEGAIIGGASA
jgi:hypothetical protein